MSGPSGLLVSCHTPMQVPEELRKPVQSPKSVELAKRGGIAALDFLTPTGSGKFMVSTYKHGDSAWRKAVATGMFVLDSVLFAQMAVTFCTGVLAVPAAAEGAAIGLFKKVGFKILEKATTKGSAIEMFGALKEIITKPSIRTKLIELARGATTNEGRKVLARRTEELSESVFDEVKDTVRAQTRRLPASKSKIVRVSMRAVEDSAELIKSVRSLSLKKIGKETFLSIPRRLRLVQNDLTHLRNLNIINQSEYSAIVKTRRFVSKEMLCRLNVYWTREFAKAVCTPNPNVAAKDKQYGEGMVEGMSRGATWLMDQGYWLALSYGVAKVFSGGGKVALGALNLISSPIKNNFMKLAKYFAIEELLRSSTTPAGGSEVAEKLSSATSVNIRHEAAQRWGIKGAVLERIVTAFGAIEASMAVVSEQAARSQRVSEASSRPTRSRKHVRAR